MTLVRNYCESFMGSAWIRFLLELLLESLLRRGVREEEDEEDFYLQRMRNRKSFP